MDTSVFLRKLLVESIHQGLLNARSEYKASQTTTNNRKHMAKWDFINTSITSRLLGHNRYSVVPLDRGLFELVMIYDKQDKTLYTVIRRQNFNKLTDRHSINKAHYIDAMLNYNYPYQPYSNQISFIDDNNFFSEKAESQINTLSNDIKKILNTDEITKYITIVINFTGYNLMSVEAILCSKWLEVINGEDWSEYLTPTYDDVEPIDSQSYHHENEIKPKIQIKPAIKRKFGIK